MPEDEALGLADHFIKPVLLKLARELENKSVRGSAGSGAVEVIMSGKQRVLGVNISPRVTGNTPALEELVAQAVNEALSRNRDLIMSELQKMVGNIKLPDGL